ncbi:MAG: EAL domain-containing protein [Deltaproteobacteria bacterium]|nr:EAL domain-containing protein [Deltaproteobacteria bacterium]
MALPSELRLLLVDDDAAIVRAYKRLFESQGATVTTADTGRVAIERVQAASFDVVLSDISMPEMSGIEFLKQVRSHDLDVPVILMTGAPGLDSAIRAVEYGAFRYLGKPVDPDELLQVVVRAGRLHQLAKLKRQALSLAGTDHEAVGDRATLEVRFNSAMRLSWMACQPIVSLREGRVWGYEALLRSDEPLLQHPAEILDAAERLGRLREVGRAVRHMVAAAAMSPDCASARIFVNLHASDLNDPDLYAAEAPLTKIASRVVLEITERASLDGVKDLASGINRLKALGFEIAIDDLGAGYAGLTSFTQLNPHVAKLDMSLVRGVDTDLRRQSIVRSMKGLCDELDIAVIAEGIETGAERDKLAELGCDLLQGFLFAKPERGFGQVSDWSGTTS